MNYPDRIVAFCEEHEASLSLIPHVSGIWIVLVSMNNDAKDLIEARGNTAREALHKASQKIPQ